MRELQIWIDVDARWVTPKNYLTADDRQELVKLGYRTRLLPFVKLKLCNCEVCKIRYKNPDSYEGDWINEIYAVADGKPNSNAVMIGRRIA